MSLHSHHYTVPVDVQLLLQIRLSGAGTHLEAARERFPLDEGCVRSRWEKEGVARKEQRPPRRYYELTTGGRTIALDAKTRAHAMAEAGKRLLRPAESES